MQNHFYFRILILNYFFSFLSFIRIRKSDSPNSLKCTANHRELKHRFHTKELEVLPSEISRQKSVVMWKTWGNITTAVIPEPYPDRSEEEMVGHKVWLLKSSLKAPFRLCDDRLSLLHVTLCEIGLIKSWPQSVSGCTVSIWATSDCAVNWSTAIEKHKNVFSVSLLLFWLVCAHVFFFSTLNFIQKQHYWNVAMRKWVKATSCLKSLVRATSDLFICVALEGYCSTSCVKGSSLTVDWERSVGSLYV